MTRELRHTRLHPSTNICVSSSVHFLRGFFSTREGIESRSFGSPEVASVLGGLFALSEATELVPWADIASKPISSRNDQPEAGVNLGDEGKETRLCFPGLAPPLRGGKGAVKEKVEEGMGLLELDEGWGSSTAIVHLEYESARCPTRRGRGEKVMIDIGYNFEARQQTGLWTFGVRLLTRL